jgi:hypothetical protein
VKPPKFEKRRHPRPRPRRGDAQGRAFGGSGHGDLDRLGADGIPVRKDIAMTGEVTLRGNAWPSAA